MRSEVLGWHKKSPEQADAGRGGEVKSKGSRQQLDLFSELPDEGHVPAEDTEPPSYEAE